MRDNELARHARGHDSVRHAISFRSWCSPTHRPQGGSSHASLSTTRPVDRPGRQRLPQALAAPGHRLGPLQLRHDPRQAVRPQQRGHRLGPPAGRGLPYPPLSAPGVLPAGRRQVGPTAATNSTSPPASPRCWPGSSPGWQSTRLALALDATSLGDCFTVLSISVVYRGHAIPVAWKVLHANVPHPWKPEWIALLRAFAGSVEPGWTVIVMTDRGLVCPLALPGDRGLGLAPRDADHQARASSARPDRRRACRSRRWSRGWGVGGRAAAWPSPRSPSGGWSAR